MSVINQMLRDLDDRQVRQPASQPTAPMMNSESNGLPMRIIAGVILFAAIIIAVYYFNFYQSESVTTAESSEIAVAEQTETTAEIDNALSNTEEVVTSESKELAPSAIENKAQEVSATTSTSEQIVVSEPVVETEPADVKATAEATTIEEARIEEPVSRVVKTNPNESNRTRAEQKFREFSEDGSSTLTSNEYQQVLAIDPSFHNVRIEWLSSLIQSNEALFSAEASSAMSRWPEVYQYRQMLARLWVLNEPRKAYDLLISDMPTLDTAPDYHGLIAYSAQQMGDLNLAVKKYELLLENFPERADWWLALGLLQEQLGSQTRALAAYQQSLRFPGLSSSTRSYAEQRVRAIQGY